MFRIHRAVVLLVAGFGLAACGAGGGSVTKTDGSSGGGKADSAAPGSQTDGATGGGPGSKLDAAQPFDGARTDAQSRLDGGGSGDVPATGREASAGEVFGDHAPDVIPPLTIDEVCANFGVAACDRLNACDRMQLSLSYGTVKTCTDRFRFACVVNATAAGARVFANPLDQCVRTLAAATCSDVLNGERIESCFPAGQRPAGAPCAVGAQCASGYCQLATACGVCAVRAAAAAKCDSTRIDDRQCAAGLACINNTCVARVAAAQPCSDTQPCQRTLSCIGGSCVASLGVDGVCVTTSDCNTWAGLTCVKAPGAASGRCQTFVLPGTGARCTVGGTPCAGSAVCTTPQGQVGDRCVAPGADQLGCGAKIDGRGCLPPATCVADLCQLPSPNGCN